MAEQSRGVPFHSVRQLGGALRHARLEAQLSQADLARLARVDRSWLVLLENGRTANPTLGKVLRVVDALQLELLVAPPRADARPDLGAILRPG
ncbi:helix-turn-helix domain-containing protein [Leifsonia sp. NPDC056824]|uniref:helix-turn-helix domain-containing protein n=1 Tax=Leifsonia sp. NPDC056824 TaxID=3345953 RepID=UPI0036B4CA06